MSKDAEHGKWYTAWCAYFQSLLDERKLNPSDFATLVGNKQNNIWRYLNGHVRPPLKSLALWGRRLHLDEAEQEKFMRLGRLAYASQEIRDELNELRKDRASARAELESLKRLLQQQGVDLSSLKD